MVSTVVIQVFVIYGIILSLFVVLGVRALLRKRNRISITLSMIFLIPALGILINILYRAIDTYEFNLIGNKLTIVLSCLGLINIYFFAAIINQSAVGFPLKKQIVLFLIYAVGSFLFNWLNSPVGRTINLIIGICIIPAAVLLYLGLKEEQK